LALYLTYTESMKTILNITAIILLWLILDISLLYICHEVLDDELFYEGVFRIISISSIALFILTFRNRTPLVISISVVYIIFNIYRVTGVLEWGFLFYGFSTTLLGIICFYSIIYFNQTRSKKILTLGIFLLSSWFAYSPLFKEFLKLINNKNNQTINTAFVFTKTKSTQQDFKSLNQSKIVVASLFNENCSICFDEMKTLQILSQNLNDSDIAFINIHTILPFDSVKVNKIRPYVPFPIYKDSGFLLFDGLKTAGVPQLIIIDKNGIIQFHKVGYSKAEAAYFSETITKKIREIKASPKN